MKILDNIKKIEMFSTTKTVLLASGLILLLYIIYFAYDFMVVGYDAGKDSMLTGKPAYVIMNDFKNKKDGMDIVDLPKRLENIFDKNVNINIDIPLSNYKGRPNPFSI